MGSIVVKNCWHQGHITLELMVQLFKKLFKEYHLVSDVH